MNNYRPLTLVERVRAELARRGLEPACKHARDHPRLYLRKPIAGSNTSIDAKAA